MSYMEYKEVEISDEMHAFLEDKASRGEKVTLQEAGFFDWLTNFSKEGWRPVWQTMRFPFIVLEREVVVEEVEN